MLSDAKVPSIDFVIVKKGSWLMRSRCRRIATGVGLVGLGGYLLSGPGTGCSSFLSESSLVAANFCFIFDCQSGILGGTVDPCSGAGSGDNTLESQGGTSPLFTDCSLGGP